MDEVEVLDRLIKNRLRRQSLLQAVLSFLKTWVENGSFRFSEVLLCFAEYARSESSKRAEERNSWCAIAFLLTEAAAIASEPGRELP